MNNSDGEIDRREAGLDENIILGEITHEARDRAVNKIIQNMEKQMDNLAMLLQKVRDGQKMLNERNLPVS